MRPRRRSTLMVSALILAGVCAILVAASRGSFVSRAAPALQDHGRLPAFSLTDHRRQPMTLEGLSGSVWIADFIFTRCAGQCPIMSTQMARLQQAFEGRPGLRFISFSVDPAYDTPEVLAAYAAHYGAQDGRWQFLTGDAEAIAALARNGFRLGLSEDGTAEEPITHSVRLVLVDRQGRIRGYYDATDEEAMRRLREATRRLLGQEGG